MASKESWFSLEGKSEANAYGFLGFQIPTATEFSLVKKNEKGEIIENHVHNGFASTDTAARYLLWLNGYINGKNADIFDQTLDENGYSNLDYALAGYNAGPHKVRINTKNGIKKRIPNYKETKEYIRDIKRLLNGESYLVQKNDSIYSIAKKFETSVPNIIRNNFNLIDNNDLLAGAVLHIVNNQSEEVIVEVEKGFSMFKIAKNTGIPMSDLLEYNDMKKDDILHIGKEIKIPALTTLNKRYSNKI